MSTVISNPKKTAEQSVLQLTECVPALAALFVGVSSLLMLAGFAGNISWLRHMGNPMSPTSPLPAALLLVSSLALFLLRKEGAGTLRQLCGHALAICPVFFGAGKVGSYFLGIPFRLEGILSLLPFRTETIQAFNVMSPNSSVCFVLFGLAIFGLDGQRRRFPLSYVCGIGIAFICLFAIVGHLYGAQEMWLLSSMFTPMMMNTALGLLVLTFGMLMARKDAPFPRMLASRSTRHLLLRLFPSSLILIVFSGWLFLRLERNHGLSPVLGISLLCMSMVMGMTVLLWWTITTSKKMDISHQMMEEERDMSLKEVEEYHRHLQLIIHHASELICSFDKNLHFITSNTAVDNILAYPKSEMKKKSLNSIIHPADFDKASRAIESVRRGLDNARISFRLRTRSGRYEEVDWSIQWSAHHEQLFMVGRCQPTAGEPAWLGA